MFPGLGPRAVLAPPPAHEHTCMKILILAGFLTLGVIYSEKYLGSIGHLQKLCQLFPQAYIYLKSAMLDMQANAA